MKTRALAVLGLAQLTASVLSQAGDAKVESVYPPPAAWRRRSAGS